MRVVTEARACAVLRNLLLARRRVDGVFLLPANVCPVVVLTFLSERRPFEFVDIDPRDFCMDRRLIRARLREAQPPVAGILFVRTYGVEGDLSRDFADWKRHDPRLLVVDDRCSSRPEIDSVDAQGADVVLYSTGRGKYADLGFGGFGHLSDDVEYVRSRAEFEPDADGRLTELYKRHIESATTLAIRPGDERLARWLPSAPLEISTERYLRSVREGTAHADVYKACVNDIYRRRIPESVQLGDAFAHWRFQIRVPRKRALLAEIFESGHFASGHYHPASRLFADQHCPEAEALYADVVNLFNDRATNATQAEAVAELVRRHVEA